ncbi:2,3-diketo-5-methylthio-1-phosphopentane phosphatase [Shewanella denitrificans OS217]|jgi:enolase-phosphatase E1|uniref:Enolase-phosphatase E1 n=1 Tax=Shewanella denitrificans (strain OS217 / ATCC BAA-1090 / DSM 15013) TaxID=318161 RepID=MTNC_SHEDO|nr:acireductone synthase [Shewanella denitrificans]Q12T52.1 RecName: Full=Enolase-phosphatase E1; AltName: Full=2,3-diketo-5-methylthio-1-phosphopentane phosphatase [Shewanella denitrificans OS217]ABE53374.1 2,3-diketo-5-methylthio-1-phosphopentane phosphatase [Shewanella denitrificans OS217]
MSIKAIVVDTAGTTTDLNFIQDVLFPYSHQVMASFLAQNQQQVLVESCINDVRDIALEPSATVARVAEILQIWITEDRKLAPLKTLQGLIWKQGYSSLAFQGQIYPDFIEAISRYRQQGVAIYSFSSGSVEAQKLLFSHSEVGDLTPMFSGHFDMRMGNKLDKQAYLNIHNTLGLPPKQILFVSDTQEELTAAQAAGMMTCLMSRGDAFAPTEHKQVGSFTALNI